MNPSIAPLAQVETTLVHAAPDAAELSHVADLISSFLDPSPQIPLPRAVAIGCSRLVTRVLTRIAQDPEIDATLRSHSFANAFRIAIQKNDLALVQQLHAAHPEPLFLRSLCIALQYGSLDLVEWIVAHRADRMCSGPGHEKLCSDCLHMGIPSRFQNPEPARVLEWLHNRGVDYPALFGAFATLEGAMWLDGRVGMVNRLANMIENRSPDGVEETLEVVLFLVSRRIAFPEERLVACLVRGACRRHAESIIDIVVESPVCDTIRDKFVWAPTRPGGAKVLQWDAAFMASRRHFGSMSMAQTIAFFSVLCCHVDTLMWLLNEQHVTANLSMRHVPRSVSTERDLLAFYEWMIDTGVDHWIIDDQKCAARKGWLGVIQWLNEHKPDQLTARTMDAAAEYGHLDVVQWLHEHRTEGCTVDALNGAAKNGHLEVVQWLSTNRTEGNGNTAMVKAALVAEGGHVDVIAWMYTNRTDCCGACLLHRLLNDIDSVENGQDVVRWLSNHNTRASNCTGACVPETDDYYDLTVPTAALCNGELMFARDLHRLWPPSFDVGPIEFVAKCDHLPCLQWLHSTAPNGIDWSRALEIARNDPMNPNVAWLESIVSEQA